MRLKLWLLAYSILLTQGCFATPSPSDISLTTNGQALRFGNSLLELRIDLKDGIWRGLTDRKSGLVVMDAPPDCAGVDFTLNGEWVGESRKQLLALGDKGIDLDRDWRFRVDPLEIGEKEGWASPDLNDSAWRTLRVPGAWEQQGVTDVYPNSPAPEWMPYNGYAWYRTAVTIPRSWTKGDLTLYFGAIDDLDWVYFNGKLVGKSTEYVGNWWEKPRVYNVPASLVRWGEANSIAVRVYDRGGEGGITKGPVFIATAAETGKILVGDKVVRASPWKYLSHRLEKASGKVALTVVSEMPGWRLTQRFNLRSNDGVVERQARLENVGERKGILRLLRFTVEGLGVGEAAKSFYRVLANYPPKDVSLNALSPNLRIGQQYGASIGNFVILHNPTRGLSLIVDTYCDQEQAWAEVTEGKRSIQVDGNLGVVCRAEHNRVIDVGTQFVSLVHGDMNAALNSCYGIYDRVGLAPPALTDEQAARAIIYSAHPGGTIDSWFRDVGGYDRFAKLLPSIHDLGANVLWFLPIWKGPVYAPDDYYALDEQLGAVEECRSLVDQAHSLGIRVLLDLVPHGPRDVSGLQEQHPDWISKMPDGKLMYWWGCLSCDYAHPGWQRYMGDHAAYWVKRLGVDGYRVDCAGGGPENWSPYNDNRPSMSNQWGGEGVLAAARREMEKVKRDPLLLAEASGPAFFRSANWTYDWPLCLDILRRIDDEPIEQFVPHLRHWLQNVQFAFPREARLMRFLENHDTLRSQLIYGPSRMRALMALIAFSRGTPLIFEEQEIGHGVFLQDLFKLRKDHDEFTLGKADYISVQTSDPAVFAVLRTRGESRSIGLVNLRPSATDCELTIPASVKSGKEALLAIMRIVPIHRDAPLQILGRRRQGVAWRCKVSLRPYEAALITFLAASPPLANVKAPPTQPRGTRPKVMTSEDGVTVDNGIYRLVVGKQTGGLLRSLAPSTNPESPLIVDASLGQGSKRFYLGSGRLEITGEVLKELTANERAEGVEVIAKGVITRTLANRKDPAMEYQISYTCNASSDLRVTCSLTPRLDIREVCASLEEVLRFGKVNRWFVRTLEGDLLDDYVLRHPRDVRYVGRYWHGSGDVLWQSRLLPLDDRPRYIGVVAAIKGDDYVAVTDFTGLNGPPENVCLKERFKDQAALHLMVQWLSGEGPTSLQKGQTYQAGYTLHVGRGSPVLPKAPSPETPVRLTAAGSAWTVENSYYTAVIKRSQGGMIRSLTAKGASSPVLREMSIYSDHGLYADYTDPSGNKVRSQGSTEGDPEPDVTIERDDARLRLSFHSYFRHPYAGGLSVINPRTEYRISYAFDRSPVIRVRCAVRPHVNLNNAPVFLAHTLGVADFDEWAVDSASGLVCGKATEAVGRLWESRAKSFSSKPVIIMTGRESKSYVVFNEMKFCPTFQNAFVHGRRGSGTVFYAFFDNAPADVAPRWYEVSYTMRVGRGGLSEALAAAGVVNSHQ